jgi:Relaxase/Mobilisation nuclease domain
MSKRPIDLAGEAPLLDIQSLGRATHPPTPAERLKIALTVRRAPEVVVKVTGGARTVSGVKRHLSYINREGQVGLETDAGERLNGSGIERYLAEDWDLDLDQLAGDRSIRGQKRVKLVHNLIFSMPPGTPSEKVLKAVRQFADNEWQLKHRYAMALHTDQPHPHVHVVVKAMSEQGRRLNIRKATLRSWRAQFAANLRELGVAANATERAVRGQARTNKPSGIHRAILRGESTQLRARQAQIMHAAGKPAMPDHGNDALFNTRAAVTAGWSAAISRLHASGDHRLADEARRFVDQMPPVQTERAMLAERMLDVKRRRLRDSLERTG